MYRTKDRRQRIRIGRLYLCELFFQWVFGTCSTLSFSIFLYTVVSLQSCHSKVGSYTPTLLISLPKLPKCLAILRELRLLPQFIHPYCLWTFSNCSLNQSLRFYTLRQRTIPLRDHSRSIRNSTTMRSALRCRRQSQWSMRQQ